MNTATTNAPPTEHMAEPASAKRTLEEPQARTAADVPPPGPAQHVWRPPRKRLGTVVVIVLLAAGVLLAILTAWNLPPLAGGSQSTDNAYIRGLTMSVAPQ